MTIDAQGVRFSNGYPLYDVVADVPDFAAQLGEPTALPTPTENVLPNPTDDYGRMHECDAPVQRIFDGPAAGVFPPGFPPPSYLPTAWSKFFNAITPFAVQVLKDVAGRLPDVATDTPLGILTTDDVLAIGDFMVKLGGIMQELEAYFGKSGLTTKSCCSYYKFWPSEPQVGC